MKSFFKHIIVFILTLEAKAVLKRHKPKVVAVTGNVGKTSTKDAIYTALATEFYVRKSVKSFNSEIGVPLTILGCNNAWNSVIGWLENIIEGFWTIFSSKSYPEWLILEVGADRPGDISYIASWLKVNIAVYTKMSDVPVHVEFFESPEHLFEEKKALISALPADGVLILNTDDEKIMSIAKNSQQKVITYGTLPPANVLGEDYSIYYEHNKPAGIVFKAKIDNTVVPIKIAGILGNHHIYPILAGVAVGISQKLNPVSIAEAFSHHETPNGRMKIINGIKNTTIIDDSYNSSPIAVNEALSTLQTIKAKGKKIVVLGDMLELGKHSAEAHKKVGEKVAQVANMLITVGLRARGIAESAIDNNLEEDDVIQDDDSVRAGRDLQDVMQEGDIVLIKGSQVMRMEKIVEEVMADPERAKELLVRQEKEWKGR